MADGAYRWFGSAPAPDPARLDQIDASYDERTASAFGESARATAVGGLEQAAAAARAADPDDTAATLAAARAQVEALRPEALEPRRGLAGLFDSRGRRLKRLREAFHDTAARLTESTASMGATVDGAARRSGALDAVWSELRAAVTDLDAHIAAAARRLTGHTPAEDDAAHPLQGRTGTLDACRAAALQSLSLIRGGQNADARTMETLQLCTDGLAAWREDWRDALGLTGKRPRRIRPDTDRLARSREQALARIDRTLGELASLAVRRADVERRLAAVAASLKA